MGTGLGGQCHGQAWDGDVIAHCGFGSLAVPRANGREQQSMTIGGILERS